MNRLCGLSVEFGAGRHWAQEGWRAVVDAARTAELCGFHSLWLTAVRPVAGELQPNAALVAAAVAVSTERLRLRVELPEDPRQDPLRVAEDWSVVDNLADTRVELISAIGPIRAIRDLWGGTPAPRVGPGGEEHRVHIHPVPQRPEPVFWLADAGEGPGPQLAAEMSAGVYVRGELALDRLGERVEFLREQFRAVTGKPGRVAVAAGPAIRPDDVHALGVEEVVYRLHRDAGRGSLGEAITELARAAR